MEVNNRALNLVVDRIQGDDLQGDDRIKCLSGQLSCCPDCHIDDVVGIKTRRKTNNDDKSTCVSLTQSSSIGVTKTWRVEGPPSVIY